MRIERDGVGLEATVDGPDDGPVVVLVHGFPELAWSWRHQLPALAEAGFRVIAPDLRGFGRSDAPQASEAYAITELADDVVAWLDHAGVEQGVVVGHDWGADVAWKTAWLRPERVRAVGGLSVPFIPPAPAPPIQLMRAGLGEDFYIVWFQTPGVAEEALERDVRRTMATTKQWTPQWAADTDDDPPTPRFMTDDELAVYVDAFERTGFAKPLELYRNIDRNWERTKDVTARIEQPAFFLAGERDPAARFMPAAAMDGWVTNLEANVVVPGAGHWVNQERPDEVNTALLDWLAGM